MSNLPTGCTDRDADDALDPAVCVECEVVEASSRFLAGIRKYDIPTKMRIAMTFDVATAVRDAIADNGWRIRTCAGHAAKEHDE